MSHCSDRSAGGMTSFDWASLHSMHVLHDLYLSLLAAVGISGVVSSSSDLSNLRRLAPPLSEVRDYTLSDAQVSLARCSGTVIPPTYTHLSLMGHSRIRLGHAACNSLIAVR